MSDIKRFLFETKWHILACIILLSLLFLSKYGLGKNIVSIILDPILIVLLTSDIFYLFINKSPEFKERQKANRAIYSALMKILENH